MTKLDFKNTVFVLSEKLFPMVSRLLGTQEMAEDAIQEIMIKIWHKRKNLKETKQLKHLQKQKKVKNQLTKRM